MFYPVDLIITIMLEYLVYRNILEGDKLSKVEMDANVVQIEKNLRMVDFIIRKKGREILNDFNITGPQFTALQWLISDEKMTIGELSQKMSLACSTITDLIDRMEKSNLVLRTKDEQDKRVVRLQVQPVGHDLVKKVLEKRQMYLNEKLSAFTEKDKLFLSDSLKALYEAMGDEGE